MTRRSRRLPLMQLMALTQIQTFTPQKTTGGIWRRFTPDEHFSKAGARPLKRLSGTGQVSCRDRGRPARNERESAKILASKDCAPNGASAGGTPAVPAHHVNVTNVDEDRRHTSVEGFARARLRIASRSGSSAALHSWLLASGGDCSQLLLIYHSRMRRCCSVH